MVKISSLLLLPLPFIALLTGCHQLSGDSTQLDESQQEYILSKVNNYDGLIDLYRAKLQKQENAETRYQLAYYYYQAEDYESSSYFLQPLLMDKGSTKVWLLESKNQLRQGNIKKALALVDRVLAADDKNSEAYNIRGILLAQQGDYDSADQALNQARQQVMDDKIVINNLAMVEIMRSNYAQARDYLMPIYIRGEADQRVMHNLVYALVQLQEYQQADTLLKQENMDEGRTALLRSLSAVKPHSQLQHVQTQETPAIAMRAQAQMRQQQVQNVDIHTKPHKANDYTNPPLKEVSAVRIGEYNDHFRMTLESKYAINFHEIKNRDHNKHIFELYNVKLGKQMLNAAQHISPYNQKISNIKFYQQDASTLRVELDIRDPDSKTAIFRIPGNRKKQERLVFDIYHGG